ncbi:similar to Saccharomyces cerevisiae YPR198W Plasma membrane multidrug transporter [Maudiozyma saulgeensis]|uniref:Similar to Saccharomyces cerevisiae YPR198W Plasma membrane multidrug transporter n=1 Tax=Maudiozyma saulgeensis TaxID=1789683 RepID=A0A1X7RCH3_9SACH|nr:similar to Saccharomyces cerevisiae YPR198W Plasma membrane multidrug transporter [Kazachstania saulgeensis]
MKTEGKKNIHLTFFVIAMACAFDTSCVAAMVALNQNVQEEFNISYTKATWGLTSYAITFAGFIAFFGRLGDIAGNHYLFSISTLFFSICSLLCATVPNFEAFSVFRALQGIAGAGIVPSSYALIPTLFDDSEVAAKFLSVLSIVFAAFFGIGFILGGAFAMSSDGYRGLFYLVFAVLLLIFISSYWLILPLGKHLASEDNDNDDEVNDWTEKMRLIKLLDYPGSFFFIAGSIFIVVGLTEGGESWKKPVAYVCFVVGIVLLGIFFTYNIFFSKFLVALEWAHLNRMYHYMSTRQILIPQQVMCLPNFWPAMITCFLNYCCFLSNFYIINQYSLFEENNSPIIASIKLLPVVIALVLSNCVSLFIPNTLGPKNGIIVGFVFMFASSIILIQIKELQTELFWKLFFVTGLIGGFGSGLYFPYMLRITVGEAPLEYKGITSGVMQTFGQFGSEVTFSVLASILGELTGSKADIKTRFQNTSYFSLASSVSGLLISVVFLREHKVTVHDLKSQDSDESGSGHSLSGTDHIEDIEKGESKV